MDTATTAPIITKTTTPPDTMLSKKFLSEGDTPSTACATSGTTIDAVSTPVVNPATTFSLIEEEEEALMTTNLLDDFEVSICFEGLIGNGLKKSFNNWLLLLAFAS